MGNRPQELLDAVRSVQQQRGPDVDVVVLGNGADVPPVPPATRTERLPENLGIPGGRNVGVEHTTADVILFLDDDGRYPDAGLAERVRSQFAADPELGIVSFRVVDPVSGRTQRRHVPRLRATHPERSSDVTTFLGGACAVRRRMIDEVGPLPAAFFYGHEETDLAWRALDAGWRIRYDAEAVMEHPAVAPSRHAEFYRLNARNRVWLARRNLPLPLVPVYTGAWCVLTLARTRDSAGLRAWWSGFVEGWRTDAGRRRPMRWGTVVRMTALGRPPIV
jgi:GT2 family glycosyltransferase